MKKFLTCRNIIITVILLIILIGAFIILRPKSDTIRYITTPATKGSITVNVSASGTAAVSKLQNAGFRVAGRIAEIDVKVGQKVTAGQTLAKLDSTTYQNALNQSQAALNQAYDNYNKTKLTGYRTSYDLDTLQQAINSAQARANSDQDNLNATVLKSSINGVVTSINVSVGDNVSASGNNSLTTGSTSAVMTVIDQSSMIVNLTVGESDITQIKTGQIAQISFDALGTKKYVGKVQSVDILGTVTSNVVSYNVKLSIDKVDSDIKPNMTANASILIATKDNVITVPNSAIKTVSGQKTVQLLESNQPVPVPVTTGLSNDTITEIVEGINENDPVITSTIGGNSTNRTTTNTNGLFGGGAARGAGGGGGVVFRGGGG